MAKMPVNLRVPIQSGWRWGTTLQIFTDQGDGSIDTGAPLLAVRALAFPNVTLSKGYGYGRYGHRPYGRLPPLAPHKRGYGRHPYGHSPNGYGYGAAYVEVPVYVDQGFGPYKFAAKAYDEGGNAQAGALVEFTEFVSGEDPEPLSAFAYSAYDGPSDRITCEYTL
jgi:hypothetical protein